MVSTCSEYELKLKECLSVNNRVKTYEQTYQRINEMSSFVNQINIEREHQIKSMGGVLKMINIAGGMVGEKVERGTQTGWHFPTVSSHIFTEVKGEEIQKNICSKM